MEMMVLAHKQHGGIPTLIVRYLPKAPQSLRPTSKEVTAYRHFNLLSTAGRREGRAAELEATIPPQAR